MINVGTISISKTMGTNLLLAATQKEESCWNAYMFCNFHVNCVPIYYKALFLSHIEKKVLFV